MPTIATNYFDKLTELEKEEIKEAGKVFGDVKLYEYIQKGAGLEEFIKFILSDFNLKNLIRDAIIWDGFKLLLQKIFSVITKKTNKPTEIQVWIEDKNNPASVNIALSIKKIEDIQELMVSLKAKLEVEIFSVSKEQQKGKIFWITLDKDSQNWLVKIL